jgi:amino acid adenylation domain-containing protein
VSSRDNQSPLLEGVAIIGMAGRFPGAQSVAEFWRNQLNGVEAISHFRVDELEVPNAEELSKDPNYVRARSILEDVGLFDAEFFGILPREAELMDPQQRLFLESCWQAFEDAGYDPATYPGPVGVYAGSSQSTYFLTRLCTSPGFISKYSGGYQVGSYPEMMGNNPDFLCTRVSYKLNLRGPSFTMVSGCSTSLMAVTQACQSLLTYQSDMALAGGSSITFPQKRGSYYQDGGMVSPDGHCRTFSADAQGTVFGSGVAVVLLKRLEDAVRDGDQIYAVIRGFAANNDGSAKVGYTAPSVEGQAQVIALAHEAAGVNPETIGYIEAHGTGTPLGDPIELAALTQAFHAHTKNKEFCAIGTAKTNVGHLDIAAGVTGLIHAAHIVRHGVFPPTLHFNAPNPKFDLQHSPFYVNSKLKEWKAQETPRRAGVSAFGVGGTNAHVVIEQAPDRISPSSTRPVQLLTLSARSEASLDRATENLAEYFKIHPDVNFADAAWTLQAGRRAFPCRRTVIARDVTEAIAALTQKDRKRVQTRLRPSEKPEVYFLFPGQGSQHANMAREIYDTEPVFHETVDRCAKILLPHLGADLRTLLYPPNGATEEAKRRVTETIAAQPAIFTIEYALAQLWMSWGVRPQAMLGHSIGEFVAACLAGIFSLEDGLSLVAARGRMMQEVPAGGMLSVRMPESEVRSRLNGTLALAAVNAPSLCVVAGPFDALEKFEQELSREGIACRRLVTSHAFHSAMMDPLIEPFTARVAQVNLHPPKIPYISGVTGKRITPQEATDPSYWARHFRQAVQFSAGVTELRKNPSAVLLEVGPGNVLSTLARQHTGIASKQSGEQVIVSSLSDGYSGEGDATNLMNALGSLWLTGVHPDWSAVHAGEQRQRISLPTYPFERKLFWLDAPAAEASPQQEQTATQTYQPSFVGIPATEEKEPVNSNIQPQAAAGNAPSRTNRIRTILAELFEELSGMQISQADGSTTFLEMGFDSLFLTQVTQGLQNKFGLKITFRQLLGDQSTLDALTAYVDEKLPAEVLAEPAPAVVSSGSVAATSQVPSMATETARPAGSGTPDSALPAGSVERLVREQLEAMNQLFAKQLEALRGSSQAPATANQSSSRPSAGASSSQPAVSASKTMPPVPLESPKEEFKPFGPYKPPQKGVSGELTQRQKESLQSLVERYSKRTAKSKSFTEEHRQALADPRVVAGFRSQWKEIVYPIVTDRSEGPHLWDLDGNEYVDVLNGFGPIFLGHRPAFVTAAIEDQLKKGFEIGPQTPLAGEVAKMFCEMTGNERMTFCNTGSEAVMAAMRVARTVTGRKKVALFANAYHGMFDEVLVKGFKRGGVPHSSPVAPGIPQEKVDNILVLDYGTPEALELIRQNAKDLAAVLVEPVQSRHPEMVLPEYLKEIRKITEQSGTALIFDEVVTGFRTHPGGCQALFGICADLATYGKVVAGGMPIGILAGKAHFMDALDGGAWHFGDDSFPEVGVTFFAGTFVRHPLALAAVKAVLKYFKSEGPELQERVSNRMQYMVGAINEFFEQKGIPTRLANFKSVCYFSFPGEERFASLFYYYLRLKGIHLLEGFPVFLTTTHTDEDIEKVIRAFKESAVEMQEGGFFSPPAPATPHPGLHEPVEAGALATTSTTAAAYDAPLTESQREVWLSDQLSKEASCAYNESFTLRMQGSLDEQAMRASLQGLLNRHDALRATVASDGALLHFAPRLQLDIPVEDLSALTPSEREARLEAVTSEEANTPFDLSRGPLIRTRLFRLEPQLHALIVTSHHIVCDGWSTNVLLDDLSRLYSARLKGAVAALPAAMQFSEYARAQSSAPATAELASVETYWLKQFEQLPPVLNLPTDRPRPAVKSFEGSTVRAHVDAATFKQIKKAGAQQGCTLFVTLLTGFATLLHRLTAQDDIVIGIPTAGQSLLDDGNLVGHCVNFLPVRARMPENQKASALLQQLKRTLLDAYEHQTYTYGTLVRKLKMRRDPSRLPLVEVQFNLEKVGTGLDFPGLKVEVDSNPKTAVNFDLFLNIVESEHGLSMDCDYNSQLFDRETIGRWMRHFEALLQGIAADSNQMVDLLPILTDTERSQVLGDWNATAADYPRSKCVHQLIEEQSLRSPDATAVLFEGQSLTYSELERRANQLARYLIRLGVKPGALIGISVDRSLEMMVGLLGIWKAGAAYLPLDPSYPAERLAFILGEASVSLLLTQAKQKSGLPEGRVVCLDRDWSLIAREQTSNPDVAVSPDALAYTIYTSGSTGKPKGVEVTHQNVVNLLSSMAKKPGLAQRDRLLAVTTLSFDIAGLELFLPLVVGAQVVLASKETTVDGGLLMKLASNSGATVMQATPATWRLMLEAGWNGTPALKILCGGEALPRELANQLVACGEVWNMYGPTETTIWSATSRVEAGAGPVTIGPPIQNTQFYVLDKQNQPLPIGVPGELHIGGDGVARGYFRRPELTAERFVPDSFSSAPNRKLYKTGDLVRYRTDGHLEFLGRLDSQVKVRGFRIELGEIESALAKVPGIRESVVLTREDERGVKQLVAYLVADQSQKPQVADLRGFIGRSLPDYMIPSMFVFLSEMPRTPNGKIDRQALPALDSENVGSREAFVAPRNPPEEKLAAICAEVLHLDRVSVLDSLFDLGADSIHLFQIIARAGRAGIVISPQHVLRLQTVAAIAAEVDATDGSTPGVPEIKRVSREQYRMHPATTRSI